MWPWDAGASAPGPFSQTGNNPAVAAALIPTEATIDLVTPADVLQTEALGYIYDGEDSAREFSMTGSNRNVGGLITTRIGQPGRSQWEHAHFRQTYASPIVVAQISSLMAVNPRISGCKLLAATLSTCRSRNGLI